MTESSKTNNRRFKFFASIEGVSFLLLIGVGLPLKHVWGIPEFSKNMGLIHGITFVLYVLAIIQNKVLFDWDMRKTLLAILLSVVPFGPFYVVRKMVPKMNK